MPGRLTEAQPPGLPQSREGRESPTASADEPGRSPAPPPPLLPPEAPGSRDVSPHDVRVPPVRGRFLSTEMLAVLIDLDRLALELRRPSPSAASSSRTPGPGGAPPAPSPVRPAPAAVVPVDGRPSPYLDERLASARRASVALAIELRQMEAKSTGLRESIDLIDRELARAGEELSLLRSTEWRVGAQATPGPSTLPRRPSPPSRELGTEGEASEAAPSANRARSPTPSPRFTAFTVDQYNRTMGELRLRWSRTMKLVLLVAGAISVALELVLLLSREPTPVWWIAVLPAVWMVPVPFFVVSFRATHRLLRQVRFGLPEGP